MSERHRAPLWAMITGLAALVVCTAETTREHPGDVRRRGADGYLFELLRRPASGELRLLPDRDFVRRILRAHLNEVRDCAWSRVEDPQELVGTMQLTLVVAPTGHVVSEKADAALAERNIDACVAEAGRRWRFPSTGDGNRAKVRVAVELRPPRRGWRPPQRG